ncbi:MAG: PQQ-binding-like beta-propeller repeat protein [Tannerella sp.]|jgi:outer membrane protein assembly factor BamB/predicted MPP superfamily phosphohydrolase|nr:PQQ-binding-like beta-propeller repeat protein [Tannerella sp.]
MKRLITFLLIIISLSGLSSVHAGERVKFAFLTDIHLAPGAASDSNLVRTATEINQGDFDFTIVTGDVCNNGSDAELNAVHQALSRLEKPYYIITGNHETNWSESAGLTFNKLWKDDNFVFEHGDFLFMGVSTGPYMKMGTGHVREEDIYWLENELEKWKDSGKTVIFAAHYPLMADLDNWFKITDILNRYGVKLDLCGHYHKISVHNFDGIIGLMGRATVPSNAEKGGYNIVEIRNDSVFFSQKVTGEGLPELFSAFSLNNNDVIRDLPVAQLPDYSVNREYPNVKILQTVQDSSSIYTGAVAVKNQVFFADSKGTLYAYNGKTEAYDWKQNITGPVYATPVIVKNTVCIGSIDGVLHGFDRQTGKERWTLKFDQPIIADGIAEGNFLYVGVGSDFCKINAKTGQLVWKNTNPGGQLQGKPAISGRYIVFGAWDTHLYALDKNSGTELWRWNNGRDQVLLSPANVVPAINGNTVFIVAPDRVMTALDLPTGRQLWRNSDFKVRESMGISSDGKTIFAKTMQDTVIAVAATRDGFHLQWAVDAGFGYEHNPCPVLEHKNILYASGKEGLLVAIDTKMQKVLWKHKCGNSSINKIFPDPRKGVWVSLIEGKVMSF